MEVLSLLIPGGAVPAGSQPLAGTSLPAGASAEEFMTQLQALLAATSPPLPKSGAKVISASLPGQWPDTAVIPPPAAEEPPGPARLQISDLAARIAALLEAAQPQYFAEQLGDGGLAVLRPGNQGDGLKPACSSISLSKQDAALGLLPLLAAELAQAVGRETGLPVTVALDVVELELPPSGQAAVPVPMQVDARPATVVTAAASEEAMAGQTAAWRLFGQQAQALVSPAPALAPAEVLRTQPERKSLPGDAVSRWMADVSAAESTRLVLPSGFVLQLKATPTQASQPGQQAYLLVVSGAVQGEPQISVKLTIQPVVQDCPAPGSVRLLEQGLPDPTYPGRAGQGGPDSRLPWSTAAPANVQPVGERMANGTAQTGRPIVTSRSAAVTVPNPLLAGMTANEASEPALDLDHAQLASVNPAAGPSAQTELSNEASTRPAAVSRAIPEPTPAGAGQQLKSAGRQPGLADLTLQEAPAKGTASTSAGSAQAALAEEGSRPQRIIPATREERPAGQLIEVAQPETAPSLAPQLLQFVSPQPQPDYTVALNRMLGRISELVQQYRAAGDGLYNAQLELDPPALGKLIINVLVRGDNVAIQVAAVSPASREHLQAGAAQLRQGLIDSGLNVAEMRIVTLDPDDEQGGAGHDSSSRQEGQAGQHGRKSTPRWEQPQKVASSA